MMVVMRCLGFKMKLGPGTKRNTPALPHWCALDSGRLVTVCGGCGATGTRMVEEIRRVLAGRLLYVRGCCVCSMVVVGGVFENDS